MSIDLSKQYVGPAGGVPVSGQSQGEANLTVTPSDAQQAATAGQPTANATTQALVGVSSDPVPPVSAPDLSAQSIPPAAAPDLSAQAHAKVEAVKEAPAPSEADIKAARQMELAAMPELKDFIAGMKDTNITAIAELAKLANEFNAKPEGQALNTLKTEYVLSTMTPDQVAVLSDVLNSGQLAMTNGDAFALVLNAHRHDRMKPFERLEPQAMLEHAISAASINNRYEVVEDVLTRFGQFVNLPHAIRAIEAKGTINNTVTGKPYTEVLSEGMRADLKALGDRLTALKEEMLAEERAAAAAIAPTTPVPAATGTVTPENAAPIAEAKTPVAPQATEAQTNTSQTVAPVAETQTPPAAPIAENSTNLIAAGTPQIPASSTTQLAPNTVPPVAPRPAIGPWTGQAAAAGIPQIPGLRR